VPEFEIDFSDTEGEQEFEILPKGVYEVHVEQIELKDSQSSEYQYLNWTFVVDEPEEHAGRKLWLVSSFSPRSIPRMRSLFDSFGVETAPLKLKVDDDDQMLVEPDLVDRTATAVVRHERKKDEMGNVVTRARIGKIVGHDGNGGSPAVSKSPSPTGTEGAKRQFK
jgi:hypothetical protein